MIYSRALLPLAHLLFVFSIYLELWRILPALSCVSSTPPFPLLHHSTWFYFPFFVCYPEPEWNRNVIGHLRFLSSTPFLFLSSFRWKQENNSQLSLCFMFSIIYTFAHPNFWYDALFLHTCDLLLPQSTAIVWILNVVDILACTCHIPGKYWILYRILHPDLRIRFAHDSLSFPPTPVLFPSLVACALELPRNFVREKRPFISDTRFVFNSWQVCWIIICIRVIHHLIGDPIDLYNIHFSLHSFLFSSLVWAGYFVYHLRSNLPHGTWDLPRFQVDSFHILSLHKDIRLYTS